MWSRARVLCFPRTIYSGRRLYGPTTQFTSTSPETSTSQTLHSVNGVHIRLLLMKDLVKASIILFLLGTPAISGPKVPEFTGYRTPAVYRGPTVPPDTRDMDIYEIHACFADAPETFGNARVNFAGHYIIRACSCGTGCHSLVMWDAATGRVFDGEIAGAKEPINVGPYEQRGPGLPLLFYKGEEYRPDSTLLIIEGCHEQTCDCGRWYYTLAGDRFKLILKRAVRKPAVCVDRR